MSVAIDQRRRDPAVAAIDDRGTVLQLRGKIGFHTGKDNHPVLRRYRSPVDGAESNRPFGERRQLRIAPQLTA